MNKIKINERHKKISSSKSEAKIKEENIYGLWEISSDQNNLTLYNDPSDEETFKYEYSISYVSFHLIKLISLLKCNDLSFLNFKY